MKGWILYHTDQEALTEKQDHAVLRLLESAKKKGHTLEVYRPEDFDIIASRSDEKSILVKGKAQELPDYLIPRLGSLTTYFASAVIRQLQSQGVYACNSADAIAKVGDKLSIHQLLAQSNLPTPKTMLVKFPVNIELATKEIGFPLILKNVIGMRGQGVYLCESVEKFHDLMELLASSNAQMNFILQEYIETSRGTDLRVFVIGGRVIGCMKRTAKQGFKANFSQGGNVEKFEVTPEIEWLASETVRLLKLDVTGIDLLFDKEGYRILEANSSPGFKGLELALQEDVAMQILDYIEFHITGKMN